MSGEERKFQTRIGTVVLVCLFVSRNSFSFSQLHIHTLGTVNTADSIRFYIIHRAVNSNGIIQLFGITTVLFSKLYMQVATNDIEQSSLTVKCAECY